MPLDFLPVLADDQLEQDLRRLVALGRDEDVGASVDVTSWSIIPAESRGTCVLRARQEGVLAGIILVPWILDTLGVDLRFTTSARDGQPIAAGMELGVLSGNVRDLLLAERLVLNIVARLCGVATLTAKYVARIEGSGCGVYDTRKTTAGWRRLEKYAVRCGGGRNHRRGLDDAILIKDNHLALAGAAGQPLSPGIAIQRARTWLTERNRAFSLEPRMILEIEVDSLAQLASALAEEPDIVLLDNFSLADLHAGVAMRNREAPDVQLEASGGITIDTIATVAATGVDRISCGALTHQATWLDLGLDWAEDSTS